MKLSTLDMKKPHHPSLKGSFESLNSIDLGFTAGKKCCICSKNFNFRKKHFCRFCQNAVCSDHSCKTRAKEGFSEPQRICDFCDQSEEKSIIKSEIDDEVSKIGEELQAAKETNEKLYKVHFEKTNNVNKLEDDINNLTTDHNILINQVSKDIEYETKQKKEALDMLENLKKKN